MTTKFNWKRLKFYIIFVSMSLVIIVTSVFACYSNAQGHFENFILAFDMTINMIFTIILYTCIYSNYVKEDRGGRLFSASVCLIFLEMVLSLTPNILNGNEVVNSIAITLYMLIDIVICLILWYYQCSIIKENRYRKVFTICIWAFSITYFILLIINLFSGFIYYIDEDGFIHFANDNFCIIFITSLYIIYLLGVITAKGESLQRKISLASFALFPMFWNIIHAALYLFGYESFFKTTPCALFLISAYIIYINIVTKDQRELLRNRAEIAEHENIQKDLETTILLSQIKPHFIYNTFTAIRSLYRQNLEKGDEAIVSFSKYLRANMENLQSEKFIPFERELENVKAYLEIEKMRFGDDLNVEYDIRGVDFLIPTFILQPIVENAIKHGASKAKLGGYCGLLQRPLTMNHTLQKLKY